MKKLLTVRVFKQAFIILPRIDFVMENNFLHTDVFRYRHQRSFRTDFIFIDFGVPLEREPKPDPCYSTNVQKLLTIHLFRTVYKQAYSLIFRTAQCGIAELLQILFYEEKKKLSPLIYLK